MVGRYVKFTARAGQGDALADLMLDVARSLQGTDGCELYAINRAAEESDVVWVTELWRDQCLAGRPADRRRHGAARRGDGPRGRTA
jgi:quinol monooxygenase YgiN